jgi:hypothetical protein
MFVLYKGKGPVDSGDSYRAISLTDILGKLFERVIFARALAWFEADGISKLPQFGFRPNSSTVDAVFTLRGVVNAHKVLAKKPCYAVFLDLKKAFPSINRTAMFRRLAVLGFPKKLLLASSALYNLTSARLRIGVLLTSAFLINAGVSEGRVLSPLYFALAFSVIWEKLKTSPFPDGDYTFCADDFWLIAFADDLVVLASSLSRANEVLSQLVAILSEFDLEFSAIKSEGMIFTPGGRCSSFDVLSTNLNIGEEALKIVGAFKYLGIWVEANMKHAKHLAVMEERARLATLETTKLARQLEVTEPHRFTLLYRAFVESQLHGMELFPACGIDVIHRVRRLFLASLFDLPADTSSLLANFIMRLLPAELTVLKARNNFLKRLLSHPVPAVEQILKLEPRLRKKNVGWSHESLIVARQTSPRIRYVDFSLDNFVSNLFEGFPDVDKLNYVLIRRRAADDDAMSFFLYLSSYHQAVCFRRSIGRLLFVHIRLVLLFLFSGLRWRISRIPLKTCPFCPRFQLIWKHFLECETVLPFLSREFVSLELLMRYVNTGRWRDVFSLIGEIIRIWCDLLSTCALDIDVVQSLAHIP